MIFNEIYGCYYNTVAKIIGAAVDGELTENKMNEIISQNAYDESFYTIISSLKNQSWQLIDSKLETPILNKPSVPLTILEKRWLKTIMLDPRIKLFNIPAGELDDIEPLFLPQDIVYFDRYLDGDQYDAPAYIANFQMEYKSIKEHKKLRITYLNSKGYERNHTLEPVKIEYSDKEDKFRILCSKKEEIITINLGRILECKILEDKYQEKGCPYKMKKDRLIFELRDERNTLERAMMRFAHYKKEVERIDEKLYRVLMEYDIEDETDVLIQIMSFGAYVKILEPDSIREELRKRVLRQLDMFSW